MAREDGQPDLAVGELAVGDRPTDLAVGELAVGHRQRLRQRLLEAGAEAFHDHELLEYLLGLTIPRRDTKPLAKRLIHEFGSFENVISAEPAALRGHGGLSESSVAALKFVQAAALRLVKARVVGRPVLSSWQALQDYLHADMAHSIIERFRVLFLNNKNVLIREEVLSEGTVNHTAVYVREIIKRALELGATALILVHNHPSGDPTPSADDIAMTREIVEAGRRLGITVHDHLVIGRTGTRSFKSLGLL